MFPKDNEALPGYSRDAELFVGTLENLRYRMVMGNLNDKKRERKEQDLRNKNLVRLITKE